MTYNGRELADHTDESLLSLIAEAQKGIAQAVAQYDLMCAAIGEIVEEQERRRVKALN